MTMRVDAYTHFIPNRFYKEVMSVGSHKDIGKRMMGVPAIFDLNVRKKVVDKFKDYNQWRTYQMSDHLPLWAEFRIDFSDEYLTEIAAPRAVISGRPRQPMRMSFLFTNSSAP